MKKRILSGILCAGMTAMMLAGCGSTADAPAADAGDTSTEAEAPVSDDDASVPAGGKICFAISYTGNDFMQGLATNFETYFENKGYDVEVASADGDATTQIGQIENFVQMDADMIVVMGVDPTGLTDCLTQARDAGVKVITFTTKVDGAEDCYVGSASEQEIGEGIAQLGSDWVDKTFADAADGDIDVTVFKYEGTPEAKERSTGMEAIENNTKCNVNYVVLGENTLDAAQEAAENLMQTAPDTKLILCYNSGMSNGVNAYIMSGSSSVTDYSQFATFGSDVSEEVMANIAASLNDEAVVRGCVSLGDYDTMFADLSIPLDLLMSGQECEPEQIGEISLITAEDMQ